MKVRFSRAVTAIGLGIILCVTSVAALAAPQQPKDQSQGQAQSATSQTGQTGQSTATKAPEQQASNGKPLSTNEDPTKIGKRNINKGIWSGGILGAKATKTKVRGV